MTDSVSVKLTWDSMPGVSGYDIERWYSVRMMDGTFDTGYGASDTAVRRRRRHPKPGTADDEVTAGNEYFYRISAYLKLTTF